MNKTAGIKPTIKYGDELMGELKQSVLLFDLIGIPQLDTYITIFNKTHSLDCEHRYIINELELLKEKGYLFNAMPSNSSQLRSTIDFMAVGKEFNELVKIIQQGQDDELSMEAAARLSCLTLNNQEPERDFHSIPLIKRLSLPGENETTKTDVLNLIIEKMPLPDIQTPWENIFEFKSDPDNIGRFSGLRAWVNRSVRSGLSAPEIKDELEHLLYQYQKSLEIHKIKHRSGVLETIVVGTAEIVENIAKLNFSTLAKGLFKAHQSKADLLSLELTAPGNELSYIYKTQEQFG